MSLTTPYLESYLTANGVDITFGFSFDAISENYVRCLVYMPDGAVITPNFTVDVAAGEVSIVSMTTPDGELLQVPPEGAIVRIYREAPESQDATASVLQAFTSKQLEKSLDKIVATVQQVDYKATHKTVRTTETERDVWLDKLTDEHNDELLKWDESGHKITTSGLTEQEIRNTTAQATTTADEAKAIATEARTTANEAKSTSNDAKAIAQNAATDAGNAVQTATDATNVANAANAKAESAKTTSTNASTKADAAVSTANSALQKANTAMVQSSDALADAAVSLENSEQAVATANAAKNTADGIDGKATSALTNSEQAVATANEAKNTADGIDGKATSALTNSEQAVATANEAKNTADNAAVAVAGKQDIIPDLATIRSNAQTGKTASDTIATYGNIVTHNVSEFATATQGAKADTAVQPSDLATVATSGSYTDLSDKPTIPTVNNPTITFTQGGVTKGSFTLNQATNDTIALDAGGGGSVDIDNLTITENASNAIQAVAVINQNTGVLKSWTGTLAEYTALETKSDDTQYIITDDDSAGTNVYTKAEVDSLVTSAVSQANAHRVIEFQAPTAENNYTWYRKYADGWVEQGGYATINKDSQATITLPVEMNSDKYHILITANSSGTIKTGGDGNFTATPLSSTQFKWMNGDDFVATNSFWEVKGMAA